jgi:hypothetical protein
LIILLAWHPNSFFFSTYTAELAVAASRYVRREKERISSRIAELQQTQDMLAKKEPKLARRRQAQEKRVKWRRYAELSDLPRPIT